MRNHLFGILSLAALLAAALPLPVHAEEGTAGVPAIAPAPGEGDSMHPHRKHPPGAMHEKMKHMTPEERAAHRARMKAKFESLPPEKQAEMKAKIEARKARHAEMREKMKNMTPEERAAHRAKMKEKFESLPPEKQAEMKERMEERREKRAEMHEKMKDMTPEERAAMKKEWREEHGGKLRHGPGKSVTHGAVPHSPITTR